MNLRDAIATRIDPPALSPKADMNGDGVLRARRGNAYAKASKIIDDLKDAGLLAEQIPHRGKCS